MAIIKDIVTYSTTLPVVATGVTPPPIAVRRVLARYTSVVATTNANHKVTVIQPLGVVTVPVGSILGSLEIQSDQPLAVNLGTQTFTTTYLAIDAVITNAVTLTNTSIVAANVTIITG